MQMYVVKNANVVASYSMSFVHVHVCADECISSNVCSMRILYAVKRVQLAVSIVRHTMGIRAGVIAEKDPRYRSIILHMHVFGHVLVEGMSSMPWLHNIDSMYMEYTCMAGYETNKADGLHVNTPFSWP